MAQYYQIVGQEQPIQTMTLEELRQYYPNITCVISNQEENTTQYPSQQVLLSSDQQIVLNSGEAPQQIIVEQGQINYNQAAQPYNVQAVQEEMVTEFQQNEITNTPSAQQPQQIYYATTKSQIIQQSPPAQMINQQIVNARIVNPDPHVNQMVQQQPPQQQQIQTTHMMAPRQMQLPQQILNQNQPNIRSLVTSPRTFPNQQQQRTIQPNIHQQQPVVHQTVHPVIPQQNVQRNIQTLSTLQQQVLHSNIQRSIVQQSPPQQNLQRANVVVQHQQNVHQNQGVGVNVNVQRPVQTQSVNQVRMQYIDQNNQQQTIAMEVDADDNQHVQLNDGRCITYGQFKQEFAQPENSSVTPITPHREEKLPPKRAAPRRSTNPNRGGRSRGGRGGQNNQQQRSPITPINSPLQNQLQSPLQQTNHLNMTTNTNNPKTFPQNPNSPKSIQTYQNCSNLNQIKSPTQQAAPNHGIVQNNLQPHPMRPQHIQQHQIMEQRPIQSSHPIIHGMQQSPTQNHGLQQPVIQGYQQPIPLQPQLHNGHIQNYSPPSNLGQNQYLDDSSNLSDEYRNSARMLVCLENGEQRLITFTLPKESCTVQDLLEQVGVPFNADTKIECISNPGSEIDYIVNVGLVNNSSFPVDTQQVLTVDSLGESQECIISKTGAIIPVVEPPPLVPSSEKSSTSPSSTVPPKSPEKPPEPPKEIPKFVSGFLAVCNHCGYLSEDFNRCQRCKTKLPDDVKSVSSNKTNSSVKGGKQLIEEKKMEENKHETKSLIKDRPTINITLKTTPKTASPVLKVQGKTPSIKSKKAKAQEAEPVVLTLSSDDEESSPKTSTQSRFLDATVTFTAIQKEPVITPQCDKEIDEELFNEKMMGNISEELTKTTQIYSTVLPCRTVRIGSYRFIPKDEVQITSLGIKMFVPLIKTPDQMYKLFIPTKYIIKVLANFNKALPVIFIYVTPSMSSLIRNKLSMEEGSQLFFDPLSKEEPYKRITLLPETIVEDTKIKIKDIFTNSKEYKMLEELSAKEANDILIRTCPREGTPNKTSPSSQNSGFTESRQLIIYPPGKGGIAVNTEDYMCLALDQFLNDVIIDFYLKYVNTNMLTSEQQEKTFIFSSFFYKRLTTKPAKATKRSNPYETDSSLTPAEKRHCRVKNWTKNVNIFEKDFIIIPINESSHWFLAIICFPGLDGCRSMKDTSKIIKLPVNVKQKKKTNTITIGNTTITTVKSEEKKGAERFIKCEDEEVVSDRDEADGDESELEEECETDVDEGEKKLTNEPIKQPCILIFDSLVGASRSKVVATLRDYLTCEYKAKMNSVKVFTKDIIRGACPKVPQQMNYTDCGLYVLQFVESFYKNPITDFRIPIKMLKNWFEELIVTRKREDISNLIKELMIQNNKDPSILPEIPFPTLNGELIVENDSEKQSAECNDVKSEPEAEEEQESYELHIKQETDEDVKLDGNSLQRLQLYNSDSSSESVGKSNESSPSLKSVTITGTSPIKQEISNDDQLRKSNRETTMSYLKSKRILRHKNVETDSKKQRIHE